MKTSGNDISDADLNRLMLQVGRHTVQLMILDDDGRLKPQGSGVLLYLKGLHFILTASHVTEDFNKDKQLCIQGKDNKYQIVSGDICETNIDKSNKIDIAFIKLEERIVENLPDHLEFAELETIGKGAVDDPGMPYLVSGFPAVLTKTQGRVIQGKLQIYAVNSSNDKPKKHYGFSDETSYILDHKGKGKRVLGSQKGKLPEPHGISGGGLWRYWISRTITSQILEYRLVGIMIECRNDKYMVLIASRIDFLINKIIEEYKLRIV